MYRMKCVLSNNKYSYVYVQVQRGAIRVVHVYLSHGDCYTQLRNRYNTNKKVTVGYYKPQCVFTDA